MKLAVGYSLEDELLSVAVSDNGRGLSQEGIARLFKPFQQAEGEGVTLAWRCCSGFVDDKRFESASLRACDRSPAGPFSLSQKPSSASGARAWGSLLSATYAARWCAAKRIICAGDS